MSEPLSLQPLTAKDLTKLDLEIYNRMRLERHGYERKLKTLRDWNSKLHRELKEAQQKIETLNDIIDEYREADYD